MTTNIAILFLISLLLLALAGLLLARSRHPKFKYYGCVTGCDNGRDYKLVNGEIVPVQCIYCLEVAVQDRHPHITQPITQYTREELEDILHS